MAIGGRNDILGECGRNCVQLQGRKIEVEVFDLGSGLVRLSGRLFDRRERPVKNIYGKSTPPGVFQAMGLDLEVRLSDLTITRARAAMLCPPLEECNEVVPVYESLEGVRVARGFNAEIRRIFSGAHGCAHLNSLVLAMGPMVAQGAEALVNHDRTVEDRLKALSNHCYAYRYGGALLDRVRPQPGGKVNID